MRILLTVAILLAGAFGLPRSAAAHPHIFIDARVVLQMEDGKVVAIAQHWTFDAIFGGVVIHAFDKDRDGKLDAGEAQQLRRGAFDALKDFNYFTVVRIGREELKLDKATGFAAAVKDGRLVYEFTVPLPQPVDLRTGDPSFLFLDKSYYVSVELAKQNPVTFAGAAPAGCRTVFRDDFENPIYFGSVVPRMLNFDCPAG